MYIALAVIAKIVKGTEIEIVQYRIINTDTEDVRDIPEDKVRSMLEEGIEIVNINQVNECKDGFVEYNCDIPVLEYGTNRDFEIGDINTGDLIEAVKTERTNGLVSAVWAVNKYGYIMKMTAVEFLNTIEFREGRVIWSGAVNESMAEYLYKARVAEERQVNNRFGSRIGSYIDIGDYRYTYGCNTSRLPTGEEGAIYGIEVKYIGEDKEYVEAPLNEIDGVPVIGLDNCYTVGAHKLPQIIDLTKLDTKNKLWIRELIVYKDEVQRDESGYVTMGALKGIKKVIFGKKFKSSEILSCYGSLMNRVEVDEVIFEGGIEQTRGKLCLDCRIGKIGCIKFKGMCKDGIITRSYVDELTIDAGKYDTGISIIWSIPSCKVDKLNIINGKYDIKEFVDTFYEVLDRYVKPSCGYNLDYKAVKELVGQVGKIANIKEYNDKKLLDCMLKREYDSYIEVLMSLVKGTVYLYGDDKKVKALKDILSRRKTMSLSTLGLEGKKIKVVKQV